MAYPLLRKSKLSRFAPLLRPNLGADDVAPSLGRRAFATSFSTASVASLAISWTFGWTLITGADEIGGTL